MLTATDTHRLKNAYPQIADCSLKQNGKMENYIQWPL